MHLSAIDSGASSDRQMARLLVVVEQRFAEENRYMLTLDYKGSGLQRRQMRMFCLIKGYRAGHADSIPAISEFIDIKNNE